MARAIMHSRPQSVRLHLVAALALAAGCGSSTITRTQDGVSFDFDVPVKISATGVKPGLLHLYKDRLATFVNEDGVPRTVGVDAARSDVAGCSAVAIGVLQSGERRTSAPLPEFSACYFRDEQRPTDTAFQGVVVTH